MKEWVRSGSGACLEGFQTLESQLAVLLRGKQSRMLNFHISGWTCLILEFRKFKPDLTYIFFLYNHWFFQHCAYNRCSEVICWTNPRRYFSSHIKQSWTWTKWQSCLQVCAVSNRNKLNEDRDSLSICSQLSGFWRFVCLLYCVFLYNWIDCNGEIRISFPQGSVHASQSIWKTPWLVWAMLERSCPNVSLLENVGRFLSLGNQYERSRKNQA